MAISTRNMALALLAALLLHMLLLAQALVLNEKPSFKAATLNVIFIEKKAKEPTMAIETQEPVPSAVKLEPLLPRVDDLIVATKPVNETKSKIRIQTSTTSAQFKRWIESETDAFANKHPESVGEFNQTFNRPLRYESPKELSPYKGNPVLRGNANFAIESKGKRTCFVKNMNLLDISASPLFISKDCTPKKKFDLNLNKPNNG